MVVLYKNGEKELCYDDSFIVLKERGKEVQRMPIELMVEVMKRRWKKVWLRNGGRGNVNELLNLLRHKPLIRVDKDGVDTVKAFEMRGLNALVRNGLKKINQNIDESVVQETSKEVFYILYESYFRKGIVPHLNTVKEIVKHAVKNKAVKNNESSLSRSTF